MCYNLGEGPRDIILMCCGAIILPRWKEKIQELVAETLTMIKMLGGDDDFIIGRTN